MALPWMHNKQKSVAGVIMEVRKPDEGQEPESNEDSAMLAAAEDILRAIESKDPKHLAHALQAAYDICESKEAPQPEESNESEDMQ